LTSSFSDTNDKYRTRLRSVFLFLRIFIDVAAYITKRAYTRGALVETVDAVEIFTDDPTAVS